MANSDNRHDGATITEAKAQEALRKKASKVKESDVEKIVHREAEIDEKIMDVPGKFTKMINQIKLLFELIRDYWKGEYKAVPWTSIAMAVGALVYFLSPVDLIPDFIPVVGYIDDAAVVGLAIKAIHGDLRTYCAHKKYQLEQYFD